MEYVNLPLAFWTFSLSPPEVIQLIAPKRIKTIVKITATVKRRERTRVKRFCPKNPTALVEFSTPVGSGIGVP